jgi:thiol:disulfide interchange protein
MKRFIYSLSLFILTLTAILSTGNGVESKPGKASPATDKSQYDVIRLTSRDFDSKVASGGVWLVEFYADWCG